MTIKMIPISEEDRKFLELPEGKNYVWKLETIKITEKPSKEWKDLVVQYYKIYGLEKFLYD